MTGDDNGTKPQKLGKLEERPQRLSKVRGPATGSLDVLSGDEVCGVIVKVQKEGYVPPGITPVSQISPNIFTARLNPSEIKLLDSDPLIESVELSRPLGPVQE